MTKPLLAVDNLCYGYDSKSLSISNITFNVFAGETYGLIGESGSGKTTIGRCIIRLLKPSSGTIHFNEHIISGALDDSTKKMLRKEMQMIFQDPLSCLNPKKTVTDIIGEGLDIQHLYSNKAERTTLINASLEKVKLNKALAQCYPEQLSGGQRQRVGIARAIVMEPKLIIADECTSALDVSIQAQVINLLKDLQNQTGCAIIFISHNLNTIKHISNNIGVLHKGHLIETGTPEDIFANARHDYTKNLIKATLSLDLKQKNNT